MENKLTELDVDFIGSQDAPLTEEEEKAISNFIKTEKAEKLKRKQKHTTKPLTRKKVAS
jgi:hypothetical protein